METFAKILENLFTGMVVLFYLSCGGLAIILLYGAVTSFHINFPAIGIVILSILAVFFILWSLGLIVRAIQGKKIDELI